MQVHRHPDPSRRDFLALGALSFQVTSWGALLARGSSGRQETREAERPNLLVLCSDQQHFQALGCVDPFFRTPALDAFAAGATVFERSFCSSPQCSPSRSSMMTGLYPHKTGVLANLNDPGGAHLDQPTIGHFLQAAGYRTAYFGKWHLGNGPRASGGWDEEAKTAGDGPVTKKGLAFLERAREDPEPFALFLMYVDPHDVSRFQYGESAGAGDAPLGESWEKETFAGKPAVQEHYLRHDEGAFLADEPPETWKRYRLFYREQVAAFDEQVGRVLEALRRMELEDRTAVLVTSDHGEMDTQHKLVLKGPFFYEHVIRMPTIVRLPERFGGRAPGTVRDHCWVNVDLVPTLLELARAEPRPCDGRSAVPLLEGKPGFEPRTSVIGEYHGKQRWLCPIRMLRTERAKYNLYLGFGEELYDLEHDPQELVNLAADEAWAERKQALRAELEAWIEANQDPFHTLEYSALRRFEQRRR